MYALSVHAHAHTTHHFSIFHPIKFSVSDICTCFTGIMIIQYWKGLMKYWIIFPFLIFGTVITNFFTIYQYI